MAETLSELYLRGVPVNWDGSCRTQPPPRPAADLSRSSVSATGSMRRLSSATVESRNVVEGDPRVVRRQSGQGRLDLDVASYPRRWDYLDRLAGAFIRSAL